MRWKYLKKTHIRVINHANLDLDGGARYRRGRIFRCGVCFDAPSHTPYVFVARVVNKIHNINIDIVYLLKSKYMGVIQSKFTKTNP